MNELQIALVMTLAVGVAGSAPAQKGPLYFPPNQGEWETTTPEQAGWDAEQLHEALEFARQRRSTGVVVLLRGRLLAERHWKLTASGAVALRYRYMVHGKDAAGHVIEDVASVQKSVISILVGIAQEKGLLRIEDPVVKYLGKGWSQASTEAEERITIRHLLTMTSGLDDDLRFVVPPGRKWRYNTAAYSRTRDVVAAAAGRDINDVTGEWLTGPLGMRDSRWVPRPQRVGRVAKNTMGFATTARDLARFGLMVLAQGKWGDRVILGDHEYLRAALSPSQKLNPAYGYLWWLNGQPVRRGNRWAESLIPSAPRDLVAAFGALGRKCYVVPSLGLVVTRLGDSPEQRGQPAFDAEFWRRLMLAAGESAS